MGGVVVLLAAGAILGCQGGPEEPPSEEPETPVAIAQESEENGSPATPESPDPELEQASAAPPDTVEETENPETAVEARAEPERLLRTQDLLDRLLIRSGRPASVETEHACGPVEPVIRGFRAFASRGDSLFWVIEYESVERAMQSWVADELGFSRPRRACFAADSTFLRARNLVVEIPDTTLGDGPAFETLEAIAAGDLEGEPWTLVDLAVAVDAAGLVWQANSADSNRCLVMGATAGIGLPTNEGLVLSPLRLRVFVYPTREELARRWTVGTDGTARSEACGYADDEVEDFGYVVMAAANVVVIGRDVENPAWPWLVAVLDELGGRREPGSVGRAEPAVEPLLTTQDLLDRLQRQRPTLLEEAHVCSSSDSVITGFYTFEGRTERLFWVIEYPSVEAAQEAWSREPDGFSTPRTGCFAVDSQYLRASNLVVEAPAATIGGEDVLWTLEALPRYDPVGDPWTRFDLAEAIEGAGLIWGGFGDNLSSCRAPNRPAFDFLTLAEIFDRGLGAGALVILPEGEGELRGDRFEVFLYSSIEARENQWEVAEDGTARSQACGYTDELVEETGVVAVGAANLVVVTRDAENPVWPRLVAVLDELGGRTE